MSGVLSDEQTIDSLGSVQIHPELAAEEIDYLLWINCYQLKNKSL